MSRIDWRHDGRRVLLPVALLGPSAGSDIRFQRGIALIDTGATNSGIAPRMVELLGLEAQGKRPLHSVHGEQQTERYIFRIGVFPDGQERDAVTLPYIFEDVSGFELRASFECAALIGMDILSQCDLQLDRGGNCRLCFGHR